MTNRTVQIKGYGFGSTPAQVTVTLEGNTVFTGTVTTADSPPPVMPNLDLIGETVTLCTFEIPVDFSGEKSMTCSVSNGTVIFAEINTNYVSINNPVFTSEDLAIIDNPDTPQNQRVEILSTYAVPPFSAEEITTLESTDPANQSAQLAILAAHGVSLIISGGSSIYSDINPGSDCRANVVIDGTPTTAPHSPEYNGSWWWKIPAGSTLAYNLVVNAGVE